MSNRGGGGGGPSKDDVRRAFQSIKASTIPLLAHARLPHPPSSVGPPAIVAHLDALHATLTALPRPLLHDNPSLAAYAFFPVRQSLALNPLTAWQASPRALAALLRVIRVILEGWRVETDQDGGIDAESWQQLWAVLTLLLAGDAPQDDHHGWDEGTTTVMLDAVIALAQMPSRTRTEDDQTTTRVPVSLLARLSTALLDLSLPFTSSSRPSPYFNLASTSRSLPSYRTQSTSVRLASLRLLSILFRHYLSSPSPTPSLRHLLPQILPGTVSSLLKSIIGAPPPGSQLGTVGKPEKTEVVVAALEAMGFAIVGAVGSDKLVELGLARANEDERIQEQDGEEKRWQSLEELRDWVDRGASDLSPDLNGKGKEKEAALDEEALSISTSDPTPPSSLFSGPSSSTSSSLVTTAPPPSTSSFTPTPSWLRSTSHQLHRSLLSLQPTFRSSTLSTLIRSSIVTFCSLLLHSCWDGSDLDLDLAHPISSPTTSLKPSSVRLLLVELLLLQSDEWPQVSSLATEAISSLLANRTLRPALECHLLHILQTQLLSLPYAISTSDERQAETLARVGSAAARVIGRDTGSPLDLGLGDSAFEYDMGGVSGQGRRGIERWSWALLRALNFARIATSPSNASGNGDISAGAYLTEGSALRYLLGSVDGETAPYSASTSTWKRTAIQALDLPPLPTIAFKSVSGRTTVDALEDFLQAVSRATAGDLIQRSDKKDVRGKRRSSTRGQASELVDYFLGIAVTAVEQAREADLSFDVDWEGNESGRWEDGEEERFRLKKREERLDRVRDALEAGATALWVVNQVLLGLFLDTNDRGATVAGAGRRTTARQRKLFRRLIPTFLSLLESLDPDADPTSSSFTPATQSLSSSSTSTALLTAGDLADEGLLPSITHVRGSVDSLARLDAYGPRHRQGQASSGAGLRDAPALARFGALKAAISSSRTILTCMTLQALGTTSYALEELFRDHLIEVLYPVLALLAPSDSTSPLVQSYASVVLARISHNAGYASLSNLILDNTDYVLNSVSQRLSYARLDPRAPLVLVALVSLAGEEIVQVVRDVVDEVFEALDEWHRYEVICARLVAVLDVTVKVVEKGVKATGGKKAEEEQEVKQTAVGGDGEPLKDLSGFTIWFEEQKAIDRRRSDVVKSASSSAPTSDFGTESDPLARWRSTPPTEPDVDSYSVSSHPADSKPPPPATAEDEDDAGPPPATKTETVITLIITKCVSFLSHSSPFLRSRVLTLLGSSVPFLALGRRESDLLPVINKAWPFVLQRLSDPVPHVALAATELVEKLVNHVGSFMSHRVAEEAWPRFRSWLKEDEGKRGDGAEAKVRGEARRYTTLHRRELAMLKAMRGVARDVPLQDEMLWEVVLLLRRYLAREAHEELKTEARAVYGELGRVNPDSVWVGLMGTLDEQDRLPRYLRMKGRIVLEDIVDIVSRLP